jgi:large subunit ribosomal protein L24
MQKIKKGDTVQVIAGRDKGKKGKVIEVYPEEQLVRVEGVAVQKRHLKPGANQKHPNGGIIEREAKVSLSNVMFYSEKLSRPVRVGISVGADGKKVRVARGQKGENVALD